MKSVGEKADREMQFHLCFRYVIKAENREETQDCSWEKGNAG